MFTDPFDLNFVEETRQEARWAGDNKLMVKFSVEPVPNASKSAEAGRPIFDEEEFITIIIPGNNLATVKARVDDQYRRRFADRYNRWKQGLADMVSGTPLAAWGRLTIGQIAEFNALNIHTVEQLAGLPDNLHSNILGFYGIKESAANFLKAAEGKVFETKMAAELEQRDVEIQALKSQLETILAAQAGVKKA